MLPVAALGELREVTLLQPLELNARRLVSDALELHGALITVQQPADNERASGIMAEVDRFARRHERIEQEFKIIRHDEPDDCGLGRLCRGHRCLDGQSVTSHELQDIESSHSRAYLANGERAAASYPPTACRICLKW